MKKVSRENFGISQFLRFGVKGVRVMSGKYTCKHPQIEAASKSCV